MSQRTFLRSMKSFVEKHCSDTAICLRNMKAMVVEEKNGKLTYRGRRHLPYGPKTNAENP